MGGSFASSHLKEPPVSRAFPLLVAGLAGSVLLVSSAARSDDWLQFRKDGGRTGASADRVKVPLTDIWTWDTRGFRGETPLYHTAVAGGRVYFLARDGTVRYLICANAKSGTVLWRQAMTSSQLGPTQHAAIGPVVSGSGKVFVYDQQAGRLPPTLANLRRAEGKLDQLAGDVSQVGGRVIRVFHGRTGRLIDMLPLAMVETLGELPRFDLLHGPSENQLRLGPFKPSRRPPPPPASFSLGQPLLSGDELIAADLTDCILRWMPGGVAQVVRAAHPTPGPTPELCLPPELHAFPLVAADSGFVLAEDQTHRFLALVGGVEWHRWHRDIQNAIGAPAARDNIVVAGLGAPNGTKTVTAVNAASGQVVWSFPRPTLAPELQKQGWRRVVVVTGMDGPRDAIMARIAEQQGDAEAAARFQRQYTEKIRARQKHQRLRVSELQGWVAMPTLESHVAPGHLASAGIVLTDRRVYAEVEGTIAALDRGSGAPQWVYRMPATAYLQSMAASDDHLFACYTLNRGGGRVAYWNGAAKHSPSHQIVAIRISDGQIVWRQAVAAPGSFSLSEGLVYFSNGDLTVMGPAERTYLLATDSSEAVHYTEPAEPTSPPDPANITGVAKVADTAREATKPVETPAGPEVRGDASILRLTFANESTHLMKQVRERVKVLAPKKVPLVLELDWLDPKRAAVAGVPGGHWTAAEEERLVKLCSQLASEGAPQYFDLAPEVNVYLRRYPEKTEAVTRMLHRAGAAVREAGSGCRVVVSVNVETLLGAYGKGLEHPFGILPRPDARAETAYLARLASFVDVIGLTTHPQSAFRNAGVIPPDYLLRIRGLLPQTPLIFTRIRIDADATGAIARQAQALYGRKILQNCYWLNAQLIASPEFRDASKSEERDKPTDPVRQIVEKWRSVVGWERVSRLSVRSPLSLSASVDEAKPSPVETP